MTKLTTRKSTSTKSDTQLIVLSRAAQHDDGAATLPEACVKRELPPGCAMLGFCGAPWTVAGYVAEPARRSPPTTTISATKMPQESPRFRLFDAITHGWSARNVGAG
jgi:hypothetical protein